MTEPDWYARAECLRQVRAGEATMHDWMPEGGMTRANWRAVLTCNEVCPVRDACAEDGIHNNEHGIWGGLSFKGRRAARVAQDTGGRTAYRHTVTRARQRAIRIARRRLGIGDAA